MHNQGNTADLIGFVVTCVIVGIPALWFVIWATRKSQRREEAYEAWKLARLAEHRDSPYVDLSWDRFVTEERERLKNE